MFRKIQRLHWPKNYLNLHLKINLSRIAWMQRLYTYMCTACLAQKPHIFRCIHAIRDRLGFMRDSNYFWDSLLTNHFQESLLSYLSKIIFSWYCSLQENEIFILFVLLRWFHSLQDEDIYEDWRTNTNLSVQSDAKNNLLHKVSLESNL